jgi:hypothetical protein
MTPAAFKKLCESIKREFTGESGIVAEFISPSMCKSIRLCVAPHNNKGLVANYGYLWCGDDLLYEGDINSPYLNKALTDLKVCGFRIYSTKAQSRTKAPVAVTCCKNSDCSKCSSAAKTK